MMDAAAPAGDWSSHQVDDGMLIGKTISKGIPASAAGSSTAAASALRSTAMAASARRPGVEMIRPGAAPPPDGGGHALRCPRCDSTNTKFCYYNNYSLSQPRHFCKACKRYWTRGGTLRNVPVGGGCRKNKRIKRPASAAAAATTFSASGISSGATSSAAAADYALVSSFPFVGGGGAPSCDLGFLLYGLANPFSVDDGTNIAMPRGPYELCHQLGAIGQTFPSSSTGEDYFLTKTTHLANIEPEGGAAAVPSPPLFGSVAASHLLPSALKQPPPHHHHYVAAAAHNPELQQTYPDFHAPADCGGGDLPSLLGCVKQEPEALNLGAATSGGRGFWELQTPLNEQTLEMITAEPSLFWNNMGAAAFGNGAWSDAAGCGPSVAPLI